MGICREKPQLPFQVIVVMESMLVEKESLRRLTEMGVEVFLYRSPLWRVMNPLSAHLHKKVFIQDGKAAILGGMNIRDIYALGNTHSTGWMDTDIYVEGPAVHDMQNYFLEELKFIVEFPRQVILDIPRPHLAPTVIMNTYALLKGLNESFYHRRNKQFDLKGIEKSLSPSPAPNGKTSVAIVYDNPLMKKKKKLKEKKEARSVQILIELINNAQYQIDMISPYPYFIKDLVKSLVAAAKRGVKIRFLTNSKNSMDMSFRWLRLTAFDFTIEKLLKAGVEVYKWQGHNQIKLLEEQNGCSSAYWPGATLHSKVVRIDNEISIIHSSNFNVRSTYHNVEMGAFVISAPFNKRIRDEIFDFNINQKEKTFICKKGDEELVLSMPPKFKRTPKKYSSKKKLRNFFLKPFLKPLGSFY